jgi:predicted nicotinamide N-methyase
VAASTSRKTQTLCHGLRALNSRHRDVRRLRRFYKPSQHGIRVWPTTWLLVDYLRDRGIPEGVRVLDLCCGWGLAGIFCAGRFRAETTGLDIDWDVWPFLRLHADLNDVSIDFSNEDFNDLTIEHASRFDLLIGADACFWEPYVEGLERLVAKALEAGVKLIVLADPGRPTFDRLGECCEEKFGGRYFPWRAEEPYYVRGNIIEINASAVQD